MRARDLAEPYPFVTTDDDAVSAAGLLAAQSLPACWSSTPTDRRTPSCPAPRSSGSSSRPYGAEDRALARVTGRQHDAEPAQRLVGLTAAEWAPRRLYPPPVVGPDARPLEVAALMARTHSPLVAVVERDGTNVTTLGTVTAARLMRHFLEGTP